MIKNMKKLIVSLLAFLMLAQPLAANAQTIFPNRGGTGSTSIPTAGQLLIGNSGGTFTVTSQSALDFTPLTITLPNNGLHILDTNATHDLIVTPGSNLTADRVLTISTGDAARTLTLNGNPTLDDWFNQAVKSSSSPTFAGLTLSSPLTVANGGSGAATLTGILVGNGTSAFTAVTAPSGTIVGNSDSQTLTNKTIALGSNTISGTTAQFNTALSDNDFATLAGSETFTNKTLTSPTIAKLANLTSNGFVKTSGGDGTLSVDTATYLTGNQTITLSGDTSGSGTTAITTTIGADKILESMLKAVNSPTDEYTLTYESTTGDFEWQAASGGDILTVGDCTSGNCFEGTAGTVLTFDDSDGDQTLTYDTTNNKFVLSDNLSIGAAGVDFSTSDGVLTLLGLGNGNDENLTIDFDNASANVVAIASGTGVTDLDLGTIDLNTDTIDLTGTGTINGLDAIDVTTETTLEAAIDIAGDVAGTGLGTVVIQDNAVDGTDIAFGSDAQGDVAYYNGTDWARLAAGTSGQVLKTNGAGANPSWTNQSDAAFVTVCQSGCDYTTDGTGDQVEINAALAANQRVFLTGSSYGVSASINIGTNNWLSGNGINATVITAASAMNDDVITTSAGSNVYFSRISDLAIDGNDTNNTSGSCIYAYQSHTWTMQRLHLVNCADNGVKFEGDAVNLSINNYLLDSRVENTHNTGVFMWAYAPNNHVKNSIVGGTLNNYGIEVNNTEAILIGNHVHSAALDGIYITGSGTEGVLVGNISESNGRHGFNLNQNYWTVTGNKGRNNGLTTTGDGFNIGGDYNTVVGNEGVDVQGSPTQRYGFNVIAGADNNTVGPNNGFGNVTALAINAGANNNFFGHGTIASTLQGNLQAPNFLIPSGGTLNFNSSDVLLTHASNNLTFSGGSAGTAFINIATTASPTANSALNVQQNGTTAISAVNTSASSSTSGAGITAYENDGAAMASGDRLGFYLMGGATDAANTLVNTAGISAYANEAWSGSAQGTTLYFETIAPTTTTRSRYLQMTSTAFSPFSNDLMALGTSSLGFSDAFLASGAVINFNAGDVLITHSANTLAFSGASSGYTFDANATFANNTGVRGTDTGGTAMTLISLNNAEDVHLASNVGNGNTADSIQIAFNSDVPITFGGSCCGGSAPTTYDFTGSGAFTFNNGGAFNINEGGNAVNFRVESDTNANMLVVDGTNNRVGIGTASPGVTFDVVGVTATDGFNADRTITAGGTTGAQTINKMSGTVNFAAAATSITVTNSLSTTSSIIYATTRTNDSTCTVKNVVPGSGSFVINMTAACTAETSVGFMVTN